MRDIVLEETIYPKFTTRAFATGVPTTLAGTPVLSIYEENNLTQITAGVSITADYDSIAGLNQATIVATAANGYEAGKSYDLVITTGNVGGVSVIGEVVGSFTIEASAAAQDLANGTDGLGAIKGDTAAILIDTDNLQTNQGNWLTATGFATPTNITAGTITTVTNLTNLPAITSNWLTAAGIAASALDGKGNWNIGKTGYTLTTQDWNTVVPPSVAQFNARTILSADYFDPAADIVANVALVGTTTVNTDMVAEAPLASENADAVWDELQSAHTTAGTFGKYLDTEVSGVGGGTAADIADAVWDELLAGHVISGSAGEALSAAGTAGDPWTTLLPGAYGAGTAGKIIGDNINAPLDVIDTNVDSILDDTGTSGVLLSSTATSALLVDDIWDEPLTGITHNVPSSSGRRVRNITSVITRDETAQGPGTGPNQIQLDTGASAVDGAYDPSGVAIVGGTGSGQARQIFQYDGTTKTCTVDRDWKIAPDATSEFIIIADAGREHVNEGLAQAGTSTTITLNALASSLTEAYDGQTVFLRSGTGEDQAATVVSYDGTTKIATIEPPWGITPDTTTAYAMLPTGRFAAQCTANVVWDEPLTGATHNVNNSSGKRLRQIQEAFVVHDGTAQAGTGNTITLDALASSTNDIYSGDRVVIVEGTGIQEHGIITAYDGTTKIATMSQNWSITPDNTSVFELTPADVDVETWQHVAVLNSATSAKPCVDVFSVSDDTAAADNLELDYDGTGYNKANSTIGTTTVNTDMVAAPDNAGIAAIQATTDKFVFTVANQVDSNAQYVNNQVISGDGGVGTEFQGA